MSNLPSEPQTSKYSNSSASNTGVDATLHLRRLQSLNNHAAFSLLNYILRQRTVSDHVVNSIFLALPLSGPLPPSLKKRILLRRLTSELSLRSVSYKTLETLELIEELDRQNGVSSPSESLKAAYCATAASCSAAAIRRSVGDFYDAVHQLWLLRFCDIVKSPAKGLVSLQLCQLRDIMWEAVKNPSVRPLVASDELEQTLERIQFYLREVWDVDPLFPQEAVGEVVENGADLRNSKPSVPKRRNAACAVGTELEPDLIERDLEEENEIAEPMDESGTRSVPGGNLVINNEASWQLDPDVGEEEASKLAHPGQKGMVLCDTANKDAELLADNREEACNDKFKGDDGLERRVEMVSVSKIGVEDASTMGKEAAIILNKHLEPSFSKEMEENQSGQDANVLAGSADKVLDFNPDKENPSLKNNNTASVPRTGLMEKNPTAHTVEWTESPPQARRFHLPSPQREGFSPLKLIDDKNYVKRRKRRPWALLEEETLIEAVKEYGKGSWKAILSIHPDIFKERTEVDLKDKWRNLTKVQVEKLVKE